MFCCLQEVRISGKVWLSPNGPDFAASVPRGRTRPCPTTVLLRPLHRVSLSTQCASEQRHKRNRDKRVINRPHPRCSPAVAAIFQRELFLPPSPSAPSPLAAEPTAATTLSRIWQTALRSQPCCALGPKLARARLSPRAAFACVTRAFLLQL